MKMVFTQLVQLAINVPQIVLNVLMQKTVINVKIAEGIIQSQILWVKKLNVLLIVNWFIDVNNVNLKERQLLNVLNVNKSMASTKNRLKMNVNLVTIMNFV